MLHREAHYGFSARPFSPEAQRRFDMNCGARIARLALSAAVLILAPGVGADECNAGADCAVVARSGVLVSYLSHSEEVGEGNAVAGAVSYELRNAGDSALVAVRIRFEIETEHLGIREVKGFSVARDNWGAGGGFLRPGRSLSEVVRFDGSGAKGKIVQIKPAILYAELADGRRFGDAAFASTVRIEREAFRLGAEALLNAYRSGGEGALRREIEEPTPFLLLEEQPLGLPVLGAVAARSRIADRLDKDGAEAAVGEARRVSSLAIP